MVFVKVRETYDLHTTQNKMTVISIHTPKPGILKANFPGLLMQCRAYRPYSCDVRVACASVLPLDPQGVGTAPGDVAPEDVFNPILYKAMSNKGMSQLEARINMMSTVPTTSLVDVDGDSAAVDVDTVTEQTDEFNLYYGLLSNAHDWHKANPQAGLSMSGLRPLVYEMVYNVGDSSNDLPNHPPGDSWSSPWKDDSPTWTQYKKIIGKAKEFPFINCTSYSDKTGVRPGFADSEESKTFGLPWNSSQEVPWIPVVVGAIIVPPSKLHELFYRMVIEWTIEFSSIRPIGEITNFAGLALLGSDFHYQNYSYSSTKEAITGSSESVMDHDSNMASANVDLNKVM